MKISNKLLVGSAISLAVSGYLGKSHYDAVHDAHVQRKTEIASLDKIIVYFEEKKKTASSNLGDCYKSNSSDCEDLVTQYRLMDQRYSFFKLKRDDLVDTNFAVGRSEVLLSSFFGSIGLAMLIVGLSKRNRYKKIKQKMNHENL